jgi:non-canonical purine NTP pyrophosphatase (RdgB/HAM1 family)
MEFCAVEGMITLITGNDEKFKEIQHIMRPFALVRKKLDLPEIQAVEPREVVLEKVQKAVSIINGPVVVEDGGFHMNAYNGFPGALVKWLLDCKDVAGMWDMVKDLDKKASVKLAVAYCEPANDPVVFEGVVHGTMVAPGGDTRFYFDQVFIPDGCDKRWSEMSMLEKNKVSHRYLAYSQLKEFLKKN